tara:strand:- start:6 stop:191 length:186 start_codon:yes stop_codon:yes gene_type:complete
MKLKSVERIVRDAYTEGWAQGHTDRVEGYEDEDESHPAERARGCWERSAAKRVIEAMEETP